MKKLSFLVIVMISLASCEKLSNLNPFDREEKKTLCPVVAPEQVPVAITNAFSTKYPGASATIWFNKDNTGFCAAFTSNGVETKALFDNNGSFVKEEIEEHDQKGNHQDEENGCECELKDHED